MSLPPVQDALFSDLGPAAAGMCRWLHASLTADRAAVAAHLDHRHQSIMVSLVSQLGGADRRGQVPFQKTTCGLEPSLSEELFGANGFGPPTPGIANERPQAQVSRLRFPEEEPPRFKEDELPHSSQPADVRPDGSPLAEESTSEILRDGSRSSVVATHKKMRGEEASFSKVPHSIAELASHPAFDLTFGALILANAMMMALEVQYTGLDLGYGISYDNMPRPASKVWPGADVAFEVFGMLFGILFTIELFIKMRAAGWRFVMSGWNVFDSVIIASWIMTQALPGLMQSMPVKPMILRLARLARLMRIVRVLKFVKFLDSLNLLVSSILASCTILFWSALILFLLMMTGAMVLNFSLMEYMEDPLVDEEKRRQVFKYFGTFTRSMLSMFEVTLGNWIPITRALLEGVSEWYMGFFIIYKVSVSFAVVKVITGVFMHETFKVAQNDDDLMVVSQTRQQEKHRNKMMALMAECDDSGDGTLDKDEFIAIMTEMPVKTWLSAMELRVEDPVALFELLDNDPLAPGIITGDELASGVSRLKGPARALDMALITKEVGLMRTQLESILATGAQPRPEQVPSQRVVPPAFDQPQLMSCIRQSLAPLEHSCNELVRELQVAATAAPANPTVQYGLPLASSAPAINAELQSRTLSRETPYQLELSQLPLREAVQPAPSGGSQPSTSSSCPPRLPPPTDQQWFGQHSLAAPSLDVSPSDSHGAQPQLMWSRPGPGAGQSEQSMQRPANLSISLSKTGLGHERFGSNPSEVAMRLNPRRTRHT